MFAGSLLAANHRLQHVLQAILDLAVGLIDFLVVPFSRGASGDPFDQLKLKSKSISHR